MSGGNLLDALFVFWAYLFHIILVIHFALRKWRFDTAMRYGPIVYALSIPAVVISILLVLGGKDWFLWLSGFMHLIWAVYGYSVEYLKRIEWRNPIRWQIFAPYMFLYLATIMFYWWPLGRISRPLWYAYAALFIVSTMLNVTSHRNPEMKGV